MGDKVETETTTSGIAMKAAKDDNAKVSIDNWNKRLFCQCAPKQYEGKRKFDVLPMYDPFKHGPSLEALREKLMMKWYVRLLTRIFC